jgi:sporulation protein YlmC with PRC-barrel domain
MANEISNTEIQQMAGKPVYSHEGEKVGRVEHLDAIAADSFARVAQVADQ